MHLEKLDLFFGQNPIQVFDQAVNLPFSYDQGRKKPDGLFSSAINQKSSFQHFQHNRPAGYFKFYTCHKSEPSDLINNW